MGQLHLIENEELPEEMITDSSFGAFGPTDNVVPAPEPEGRANTTLLSRIRNFFSPKHDFVLRPEKQLKKDQYQPTIDFMVGLYQDFKRSIDPKDTLTARYNDYVRMDTYPEISRSIDVYTDDATQRHPESNQTMWIESSDTGTAQELQGMINRVFGDSQEMSWDIVREIVRMGNDAEEILIDPGTKDGGKSSGVIGLNYLPPECFRRIETDKGELVGFLYIPSGKADLFSKYMYADTLMLHRKDVPETANPAENSDAISKELDALREEIKAIDKNAIVFEDWQVVHFRIVGKNRRSGYGHSVLEPARYIYTRLVLFEDAMLIHKLTRAPGRYVFYVDVGSFEGLSAMNYVNKIKQALKKRKVLKQTGEVDFKYNPLSIDEDIFVPARDGKRLVEVESISGPDWQSVDEVTYFHQKLFAAIGVPKAYLGYEEAGLRDRTLSQQDVRFSRTVMRIQTKFIEGVRKICNAHLIAIGKDPEKVKFKIMMVVPSNIFIREFVDVENMRAATATQMKDIFPIPYIIKKVYGMSDSEAKKLFDEKKKEAQMEIDMQNQGRFGGDQPPSKEENEKENEEGNEKSKRPQLVAKRKASIPSKEKPESVQAMKQLRSLAEDVKYLTGVMAKSLEESSLINKRVTLLTNQIRTSSMNQRPSSGDKKN